MTKTCLSVALFLFVQVSTTHAELANPLVKEPQASGVNLVYDRATGDIDLLVGSEFPALTAFQIQSSSGLLVGDTPPAFNGFFDIYRADQAFKLDVRAYREVEPFLSVLAGTSPSVLHADFEAAGAAVIGGGVADSVYLVVPEASALAMLFAAVPFVGRFRALFRN